MNDKDKKIPGQHELTGERKCRFCVVLRLASFFLTPGGNYAG